MNTKQNIILIGPMGAGKSTIGRVLAKELHRPFFDTDQEIMSRTGADISWIFDIEGEAGFRKREHGMIDELTQQTGIVLATGGGAILLEDNRKMIAARGTVVYLEAGLDQQLARTRRAQNRPLLQTDNVQETLEHLHGEREPLYASVADVTVATDGRAVRAVMLEIIDKLNALDKFE